MITLCIRYTIDPHKRADFEAYARAWPSPVERCGGTFLGYFLPTNVAGSTNAALALIDFPSLAAYEQYRQALMADNDARDNVARADKSGCIINEDRSFLQRVP